MKAVIASFANSNTMPTINRFRVDQRQAKYAIAPQTL
jgi:hypothetical protein